MKSRISVTETKSNDVFSDALFELLIVCGPPLVQQNQQGFLSHSEVLSVGFAIEAGDCDCPEDD